MVKKIIIACLLFCSCHPSSTYPIVSWDQQSMMDSIRVIDSILRSNPCRVVLALDTPDLSRLSLEALEAEGQKSMDRTERIGKEMSKHVNEH